MLPESWFANLSMPDGKQQARQRGATTPRRRGEWRINLERTDAYFTTKITQQSNAETHKAEGILEGESLHIGVLGVGGRHGDARERATMSCRTACSCSVDIEFIAF